MSEGTWWAVCFAALIFAAFMTVGAMENFAEGRQSSVWVRP